MVSLPVASTLPVVTIEGGQFDQFADQGLAGPIRLFSAAECGSFLKAARDKRNQPPLDWFKGRAVNSRLFYEIATHPKIVEPVTAILGDDVMLWGASIQARRPGDLHPWHCDIEAASSWGKTVSVWVGLEHTNEDSSLAFVPYSHRFAATVQEVIYRYGKSREKVTDDDIVRWARELDHRSYLMKPDVTDGEALFFDSRIWHSSRNFFHKTRRALLLQYATPETQIRIPDANNLDWPFERFSSPKPPCLMVAGRGIVGANRIVSGPVAPGGRLIPQLTSGVYPLRLPLPTDPERSWKFHPIFSGSTAGMPSLSCHVSVLNQNQSPHAPHTHDDEELLLLLTGEVDLVIPDLKTTDDQNRMRLQPGEMVYYPANFAHTLQTVSAEPANYLMFRWRNGGDSSPKESQLVFGRFNFFTPTEPSQVQTGFHMRLVFEGPTNCLGKLHCHASTLTPGAGYEAHVDAHDVAIIVLEGEVETLDERVTPHGVIFYAAGEPHGMRNPGERTAKYVVFEFHAGRYPAEDVSTKLPRRMLAKLADRRYWKRKLKRIVKPFSKKA